MYTFVIGNGPSSLKWRGIDLYPSIGCNLAIEHWDLDHVVCADRFAVVEIRKLPIKPNTRYWLKDSPLETPPNWHDYQFPGIDSGSAALKLSGELYSNEIIVIGFDGVLGLDNGNTYSYKFRPYPTKEHTREKHRKSVIQLLPNLPRVRFVSEQPHQSLETINYDQALKIAITQSRKLS